MNLLERVLTLLGANLNTVVEKSDDPEKALKQLQLDMRNQLVQVKTEVAKAIAEGHMLQKRGQTKKAEADLWLKKAEQAVQQGNDTSARDALHHYNDINKLVQRYQQQKREQEQLVITMRGVLRRLEAKITEVDTTIELLAANKRNALIQQRVFEALQKVGSKDEERTLKAKNALTDAEARARALAQLHNQDLEQQLEQLGTEQSIERQLQQIKEEQKSSAKKMSEQTTTERQRPASRTPQTGPLANPYAHSGETTKKREKPLSRRPQTSDEVSTDRDLDLEYLKKLLEAPQNLD